MNFRFRKFSHFALSDCIETELCKYIISILNVEIKLYWTVTVGRVSLKFESSFDTRQVLFMVFFVASLVSFTVFEAGNTVQYVMRSPKRGVSLNMHATCTLPPTR